MPHSILQIPRLTFWQSVRSSPTRHPRFAQHEETASGPRMTPRPGETRDLPREAIVAVAALASCAMGSAPRMRRCPCMASTPPLPFRIDIGIGVGETRRDGQGCGPRKWPEERGIRERLSTPVVSRALAWRDELAGSGPVVEDQAVTEGEAGPVGERWLPRLLRTGPCRSIGPRFGPC